MAKPKKRMSRLTAAATNGHAASFISTRLQPGVTGANGHEAVSTASRANRKAAKAAGDHRASNTGLKPGANEKTVQTSQGLGVRQSSGAFDAPEIPKRQRAAAVQDATAPATPDFLIWQLCDSAFPTGGFAHSSGLEAAWQHGEVRGRVELIAFIKTSLDQLGHAMLPFVTAAFETPEKLAEFDALCDAFTTNHVANRASRAQGRAFLTAVERIFPERRPPARLVSISPPFSGCLSPVAPASDIYPETAHC